MIKLLIYEASSGQNQFSVLYSNDVAQHRNGDASRAVGGARRGSENLAGGCNFFKGLGLQELLVDPAREEVFGDGGHVQFGKSMLAMASMRFPWPHAVCLLECGTVSLESLVEKFRSACAYVAWFACETVICLTCGPRVRRFCWVRGFFLLRTCSHRWLSLP